MNYKKEIIVRSIKILDIGYITSLYFILGVILAKSCDKYLGKFDEKNEKQKTIVKSVIELILYLWFIAIVVYIVRNVIPLIPFPLNGIYGFDHLKVKEVTSATMFSISFIYFQQYYQDKIKFIFSRMNI